MPPVLGDPSADAYLDRLAERLRTVLRGRLLGAWLVNSAARVDYLPGRSDLDVAVAVGDALPGRLKLALADELRHAALPCPAPRLELVVYRHEVLADPGPRPDWDLNLNTGPAIDDHVGTDSTVEPAHWFVIDLAAARQASLALMGPPLATLLGPISDTAVHDALRASAEWHAANDATAPNRVLNACRAWHWLETGHWASKTEAAAWATARDGDADLIRLSVARRRGETEEPLVLERVRAFAAELERRIPSPAR